MEIIHTHNLGYPRIGERRELKRATESFWNGTLSEPEYLSQTRGLRQRNWEKQRDAGIGLIPSNDFSLYDHVLDTCALVGAVPPRFGWNAASVDLATCFRMARGQSDAAPGDLGCGCGHAPAVALEMTKWFDTNYHYLVPELHPDLEFRLASEKPFAEFQEALLLGIQTKPVLLGPVSFLLLGKCPASGGFSPLALLPRLLPVYATVLQRLEALGAEWVQLDEPVFALDLPSESLGALRDTYRALADAAPRLKLLVASYFGELRDHLDTFLDLPVAALHYDAVRGADEVDTLLRRFPAGKALSLGVVDGRNVWRNDFDRSAGLLKKAAAAIGADRLWIAPSCSLLHAPVTLRGEPNLDPHLKSRLAFADEKLAEVAQLARWLSGDSTTSSPKAPQDAAAPQPSDPAVRQRMASLDPSQFRRSSPFADRQKAQRRRLGLPLFPTTTIGSFPQTNDIRTARARWKRGELKAGEYEQFLKDETARVIRLQEDLGLDLLVHGEFERNDMVEYFGEQLSGVAITENGWVQSYGSRCVKPPIIFGDVSRPQPLTVQWSSYAQSLTPKPMKGMLTGPITVLQWSFVRDDQPRRETALQIALALRDEVLDLERAGLPAIQIDEPALREGLPLRRADWPEYLAWAVDAFRLTAAGVSDETQIHTHMCYCEFNDIIESIAALDADVISIEASRSGMEILEAFQRFRYPAEVGPGVWDVHSPRVPTADEMRQLLARARVVLPVENLWVNPDCGLKTRGWAETTRALAHLVEAARRMRREVSAPTPAIH
ncbi:MAG: 5-methyltetrahydropteroyltriglutamate--homocysteine S-methyltransferase [Verrucomicrobiae bacterium]|nr:5-methyltetrahydropteroyltriglutamate--homocysteine S-methyltransferase [Verrucomicrobiae bacterium]